MHLFISGTNTLILESSALQLHANQLQWIMSVTPFLCYHLPASGSVPSFLSALQSVPNRTLRCVKAVGMTWDLNLLLDSKYKLNCVFSFPLDFKFLSVPPLFLLCSFLFGSVDELQSIVHDRQRALHWAMPPTLDHFFWVVSSHWTISFIPPGALPWFMTTGLCPLF